MKQIIIVADMEGASGIFEENVEAIYHEEVYKKSHLWRTYGRECLTSDVLAVCEACNEYGIDEILLYDGHYAGCSEFNVILEKLPRNVRVFDIEKRKIIWDRIRAQAASQPFGIITVGQHARYGEPDAYFPHSIQSPPIKSITINGFNIAEIGMSVMAFEGTSYLANIGCKASHREALELSDKVECITVKDKATAYEPHYSETFPLIKKGVRKALEDYGNKTSVDLGNSCSCIFELLEPYVFRQVEDFPWKGKIGKNTAFFEALDIQSAINILWTLRSYITEG